MSVFGRERFVGRVAYVATYAVAFTVVFSAVVAAVSLLLGLTLSTVKFAQFVLGWLLFGFAALKLRPKAAWKRDWEAEKTTSERVDRGEDEDDEESEREKIEETARFLNPFTRGRSTRTSDPQSDFGDPDDGRFRRLVDALPPASVWPIPRSARPRDGVVFAATALCMLFVSFVLEAAFGL